MSGFGGGLALDLVDLRWSLVPRGGCDRYSGTIRQFDVNLLCCGQIRHHFDNLRSEQGHSNSNRPGSVESGPITITMAIVRACGLE